PRGVSQHYRRLVPSDAHCSALAGGRMVRLSNRTAAAARRRVLRIPDALPVESNRAADRRPGRGGVLARAGRRAARPAASVACDGGGREPERTEESMLKLEGGV